ncbi:phage antirepressor KilAC domain-containing protein [Streptobacillus moniliformis]|uniref:phage antirepressor KilAC domain-containing protein n=1 Tax=Streptobacillus moniliformis TaxID=34105 RepID=UPI0007E31F5B|nr:phage antirepressor KilAC domain-containing protein [Streptobacillus moniliformis]
MELIEIKTNEKLEPIISGRELHEKLEVETKFSDWIKRMIEYGFSENIDFTKKNELTQKREGSRMVERNLEEYYLNIDMAKEICMLQRNEIGKKFRKYFIEVEKEFNSPEKIMARAVLIANDKVKKLDVKVQELENKIEQDKLKVVFAEAYEISGASMLVGELAKRLCKNGVEIGQNRLFEWLREKGYLCSRKGEQYNRPTQKSMELELMEVKTRTINGPNGSVTITHTPKITPKGQQYFINKFLKNKEVI